MSLTLKDLKQQLECEFTIEEINKEIRNIYYSQPYPFRERTLIILTEPNKKRYDIPKIMQLGTMKVLLNNQELKAGQDYFFCSYYISLLDEPKEKMVLIIDYLTLAIGENEEGTELLMLENETDKLLLSEYLESLFLHALKCKLEGKEWMKQFNKYTGVKA